MNDKLKRCLAFLQTLGLESVPHTRHTYLAHLAAVHRDLARWGCDEDVCLAGLFHSIYGTELFRGFTLPLERRGEIRALAGERAERLAYVNCLMDRASLDRWLETRGPYVIQLREGGEITLSEVDYDDVCRVHLCDYVEQIERSDRWDYRRDAYRRMAHRLGGSALAAYERLMQHAPPEAA
jgi:hypothetical protein